MLKRLFASFLIVTLLILTASTALAADGNVTYSGDAGEFIFAPGSADSPTDLFPNFKDVMPGDSIEQKILVKNDASKGVKVKIYLRALGAHAGSEDFLSKLNLRVEKQTDTIYFEAPADQTAQMTDWVYIGLLYSGGTAELNVILDVPTSLDNEDQNQMGYLDWEFMIEELPVEDTDPPATGDNSHVAMYVTVSTLSGVLVVLFILLIVRRKKNEDES